MATTSPAGTGLTGTGRAPLVALRSPTGVALATGYLPAMIVMGALCVAAALVTALFVSDARAGADRCVARSPEAGCAIPVPAKKTEAVAS